MLVVSLEGVVASSLVVLQQKTPGLLADLFERGEEPDVQDLFSIGPIETFDESILIGFPRLDVLDLDPVLVSPGAKLRSQKLGSVVDPQDLRKLRSARSCSKTRRIRSPVMDVSTSIATASRLK